MKAIVCTQYGPPDVLRLKEVAEPAVKGDNVLVSAHAAALNAGDVFLDLRLMRSMGMKPPSPWPFGITPRRRNGSRGRPKALHFVLNRSSLSPPRLSGRRLRLFPLNQYFPSFARKSICSLYLHRSLKGSIPNCGTKVSYHSILKAPGPCGFTEGSALRQTVLACR
jgi:hypothetical protein